MKYLTILHKSKYGYDIHVPALPGCVSQGDTEQEALENIKDAILGYLTAETTESKDPRVHEVEVELALT